MTRPPSPGQAHPGHRRAGCSLPAPSTRPPGPGHRGGSGTVGSRPAGAENTSREIQEIDTRRGKTRRNYSRNKKETRGSRQSASSSAQGNAKADGNTQEGQERKKAKNKGAQPKKEKKPKEKAPKPKKEKKPKEKNSKPKNDKKPKGKAPKSEKEKKPKRPVRKPDDAKDPLQEEKPRPEGEYREITTVPATEIEEEVVTGLENFDYDLWPTESPNKPFTSRPLKEYYTVTKETTERR
ncbi:balbiani ring protein 1-like [Pristis pectinata]|uniref:balbiani ring protein 1-like n=1 Tax=Pristis pectinata TaxID=685728 RepID=UPI00223DD7DC|nr:balbiani ring protein 1-like [Pristis pectinata]